MPNDTGEHAGDFRLGGMSGRRDGRCPPPRVRGRTERRSARRRHREVASEAQGLHPERHPFSDQISKQAPPGWNLSTVASVPSIARTAADFRKRCSETRYPRTRSQRPPGGHLPSIAGCSIKESAAVPRRYEMAGATAASTPASSLPHPSRSPAPVPSR